MQRSDPGSTSGAPLAQPAGRSHRMPREPPLCQLPPPLVRRTCFSQMSYPMQGRHWALWQAPKRHHTAHLQLTVALLAVFPHLPRGDAPHNLGQGEATLLTAPPSPACASANAIDNQQVTKRHTWGGPSPHLPAPPVQQHHTVSANVCMHPGGLLSPHCPCSSAQHDQDCGARPSEAWARPVTATCAAAAHSQQALPACRGICVAAAFVACQCCLQSLKLPCCRGRVQRQQADPAADMGGWLPIWLLSQWVLPTQERPEQVALVGQPAFALFRRQ